MTMRWTERLLVVGGGIFFGYLGYKLFIFGAEKGESRISAKSKWGSFVFFGQAPGLFFMLSGCAILLSAIYVRWEITEGSRTNQSGVWMAAPSANDSGKIRFWWKPNTNGFDNYSLSVFSTAEMTNLTEFLQTPSSDWGKWKLTLEANTNR